MRTATKCRRTPPEREAGWQRVVLDYARLMRWRVAHFRPAQTAAGWRTPVEADGAGFPDLVLVRERVVWVELKAEGGKLTQAQLEWIGALVQAGQEAYVWRPGDWPEVERVLAAAERRA